MSGWSDLLSSKKFKALVVGVILTIANDKLHLGLSEDTVQEAVAMLVAYMLGQGIADHGKEAAKVKEAAITGTSKSGDSTQ